MRVDFAFQPDIRLSLQLDPAHLDCVPGVGRHQVRLPFESEGRGLPTGTVVTLSGTVWWDGPGARFIASWATVAPVVSRDFPTHEQLAFEVSDEQLAALEVLRAGGDLPLRLDMHAVAGNLPNWPVHTTQVAVSVDRHRWLDRLEILGTAAAITVVIAAPMTDGNRNRVLARLLSSRQALNDGRYEDSVKQARQALDALEELRPGKDLGTIAKVPPRERGLAERWDHLRHAAHSLASAAAHDDTTTATFVWTRADAVGVLGVVASVAAAKLDVG